MISEQNNRWFYHRKDVGYWHYNYATQEEAAIIAEKECNSHVDRDNRGVPANYVACSQDTIPSPGILR